MRRPALARQSPPTPPESPALIADPGGSDTSPSARPTPTVLWVDAVTVSFDGFKALDDVSLTLARGELRCLIGPNGAGKTTLMDVITGKTRPDSGRVELVADHTELTRLGEHQIARLGIGRKFQRPSVFQGHTVLENLQIACKDRKGVFATLFRRQSREAARRVDEVLARIGLGDEQHRPAGLLSHGHKQWLEIGMLLAQDPQVLLLDEPVAGMSQAETERTAELVLSLAEERTVVVVEHDMEFVRHIARIVTVLHEGRVLAEGTMDTVGRDPKVIEVYLGT